MVDGELIKAPTHRHYWLYHKAVGIDCNFNESDSDSLVNHIKQPPNIRLFPVGRLDKDSHGLLLLTNDGELCHRLLSPQFKQPKEYLVQVKPCYQRISSGQAKLDQGFARALSDGVLLDGELTLPCEVSIISDNQFIIVLKQGLNRQIRRMAQSQGFKVIDLKRRAFADLTLQDLPVGEQRQLSEKEITNLLVCQG